MPSPTATDTDAMTLEQLVAEKERLEDLIAEREMAQVPAEVEEEKPAPKPKRTTRKKAG